MNSKCFFLLPCSFDRISRSWCFTEKHCTVPWPASFQEGWRPDHGFMLLTGLGWVTESMTNHVKQLWDSGKVWTAPLVVRHFKALPCIIVVYHLFAMYTPFYFFFFFFFFAISYLPPASSNPSANLPFLIMPFPCSCTFCCPGHVAPPTCGGRISSISLFMKPLTCIYKVNQLQERSKA